MQVALDIRGETFAERLFHAIDTTNSGAVTAEQLVTALLALQNGTLEERIAFTFSVVADDTGQLTFEQLRDVLSVRVSVALLSWFHSQVSVSIFHHRQALTPSKMLQASCAEGNVKISAHALDGMAHAFFAKAGRQQTQTLALEDFTKVLRVRDPAVDASQIPTCFRRLSYLFQSVCFY